MNFKSGLGDADTLAASTAILQHCRTIAVVGLSPDARRASFDVSRYMQAAGYRIVPVNPNATRVLGERCYRTLSEAARHEIIELVNCFRRSEEIVAIAESAVGIGAAHLWMQMGVINEAAKAYAEEAAMLVVMDRCIMVEHRRLAAS